MILANDATDEGFVVVTHMDRRIDIEFTRKDGFKCSFALSSSSAKRLIIELLGGKS